MGMDIEKLLETANFSRNPSHREQLRQTLFGADDGELDEGLLEQAAGGVGNVPPGKDLRYGHSLFDNE
jgi:hypothetical protein